MNESNVFRDIVVKVLAIIGFVATIGLLIFLVVSVFTHAPKIFSSLSGIVDKITHYRSGSEFTIATDTTVVNSGESFQITWTNMAEDGEYRFTYACGTDNIVLGVRGADGTLMPMKCTDVLTLPDDVTGLFLSPVSEEMRFGDVELIVAFNSTDGVTAFEKKTKVTVVNATIPFRDTTNNEVATRDETVTQKEVQSTVETLTASPYPASNPTGYTDLVVNIIGSGIIRNGAFTLSPSYTYTTENAIRFDVKNVGTKRSQPWNFSVVLPNGETYTSATQIALGPQEHIEFTLGFFVNEKSGSEVILTPILHVTGDENATNDTASVTVTIE